MYTFMSSSPLFCTGVSLSRHCQIFVNTNLETLALRINVECTLNCVKSCVERQTGLSSAGQKFMSGQRKVTCEMIVRPYYVVSKWI